LEEPTWFAAVYEAARTIPPGQVCSYGQLGALAGVTARMAGKALAFTPEGVPWWRVVAWDGSLPIHKKDPALALLQRQKLESEGIKFTGSQRVESRFFISDDEDS
jgi:methylated-DNA-protein-cysteine methyltransferase related protein